VSTLLTIALNAGLPLVAKVIERRLGNGLGDLAADVIREIAEGVGVAPDALEAEAVRNPAAVQDAMQNIEVDLPNRLEAYDRDLQLQLANLAAEKGEPLWARAWRPGGMYLILFLLLWNAIVLHVLNAIFKIALPPMPWDIFLGVAGLYFGLYMGGHTVKEVVGKWVGKP
jgi:hypothetical protein